MKALLAVICLALVHTGEDADTYFEKIKAVKMPTIDQEKLNADRDAYIKEYTEQVKKAQGEQAKLIFEFYTAYPEDERLPDLMVQRWNTLYGSGEKPETVKAEVAKVAKTAKAEPMLAAAGYMDIVLGMSEGEKYDLAAAIKEYNAAHKGSKYFEQIVMRAVYEAPDKYRKPIIELFLKEKPDHQFAPMLKGQLRQFDAIGKPFELKFKDAINEKEVNVKDFKGKVVMIDWWATWCGPCVAELPHVKEIYKKYHDQGFEIIGVSLDNPEDQGGLKALKDFVAKNEMPWPQYYQGKGWDSEFSSGWGIMSIPNVFLLDKKGNLVEMNVANLEESVKKLLKD